MLMEIDGKLFQCVRIRKDLDAFSIVRYNESSLLTLFLGRLVQLKGDQFLEGVLNILEIMINIELTVQFFLYVACISTFSNFYTGFSYFDREIPHSSFPNTNFSKYKTRVIEGKSYLFVNSTTQTFPIEDFAIATGINTSGEP
jgi:hypothetical protein